MFILPFIHNKLSDTPIHSVQFFLTKGGLSLLSDISDPAAFCRENDIPFIDINQKNNIHYIRVDINKLQKGVFYSFNEEGTQNVEVWRTFVWVGNKGTDPWSVNSALEKIQLSGFKVSSLVENILTS